MSNKNGAKYKAGRPRKDETPRVYPKRASQLTMALRAIKKARTVTKDFLAWTMTSKEVVVVIEAAMHDEFTRSSGRKPKGKHQDHHTMEAFFNIVNAKSTNSKQPLV